MVTTKADVMEWVETQMAQDARLREAVEARLAGLRLEQQLAALREARGLSQAQAARLVGVSQPAIAKLESGRARNVELRTLVKMVTALGGELHVEVKPAAPVVALHRSAWSEKGRAANARQRRRAEGYVRKRV